MMELKKALVVEDDQDIAHAILVVTEELGYQTTHVSDGEAGLEAACSEDFDFMILDIMLPKMKGSEVIKEVRLEKPDLPVIMLTSVSDTIDKVLLLELGADDYVTKPFEPRELAARIKTILRHSAVKNVAANASGAEDVLDLGRLQIDFKRRRVQLEGVLVELTPREYEVLALLAKNPGVPHSREKIVEQIYGGPVIGYEQSVSSHINRIRNKIERNPGKPDFLLTARGSGYLFVEEDPG